MTCSPSIHSKKNPKLPHHQLNPNPSIKINHYLHQVRTPEHPDPWTQTPSAWWRQWRRRVQRPPPHQPPPMVPSLFSLSHLHSHPQTTALSPSKSSTTSLHRIGNCKEMASFVTCAWMIDDCARQASDQARPAKSQSWPRAKDLGFGGVRVYGNGIRSTSWVPFLMLTLGE